jgi:two-component system sensor histidine kinase UhpB
MRERALLIGAELTVGPSSEGGTEVRLSVPTNARSS